MLTYAVSTLPVGQALPAPRGAARGGPELRPVLESADGPVAWPVGKIVNALLEKAKAEEPDNPVLAAIDPLRPGQGNSYISGMKASAVRAIVGQIVASTNRAPSIA